MKWHLKPEVLLCFVLLSAEPVWANDELLRLQQDPNYWVMPGGNYSQWRYSGLRQINPHNVGKLRAAWSFSTGVLRGHEGGPLVLPGKVTGLPHDTLYVHAPFPNNVFAINLATLEVVWEYAPQQNAETVPMMCCDTVNRGLAYGEGKILLQQADTTLVAIEAKTGKKVWAVRNGDPALGQTNTNAPLVVKDKVITGIAGAEFGVRCWLSAYHIRDGSLAWKAYSVGPDEEIKVDPQITTELGKPVGKNSSLASWVSKDGKPSDQWKLGGGSTWGWWSYDKDQNLLFYGSGNPGTWNPVVRPGDNKWAMTLWARDVDTGVAKWVYQMTPHDEWDYDGVNEVVLLDIKRQGRSRKALVHFDRNGFAYTLDRRTGELLAAEKFDPAVNWATRIDRRSGQPERVARYSPEKNGEDKATEGICPASLGSKDEQPVAYSPKTGLAYIPGNHVCMDYEPVSGGEYESGQPYVNAEVRLYPAGKVCPDCKQDGHDFNNPAKNNLGVVTAWDVAENRVKWTIPERFSVWSGVLATAGDVVFYGTLEGYLKAVDARTGKALWSFKTPSGIIGNVTTWSTQGKQYIGVLSGLGGWAGIGMAAGLQGETEGAGAVGAYRNLSSFTRLGGVLSVFTLP